MNDQSRVRNQALLTYIQNEQRSLQHEKVTEKGVVIIFTKNNKAILKNKDVTFLILPLHN